MTDKNDTLLCGLPPTTRKPTYTRIYNSIRITKKPRRVAALIYFDLLGFFVSSPTEIPVYARNVGIIDENTGAGF